MAKTGYGSNEFINRVTALLGGKYDKELATLQADSVTLQQIKMQSLIMLEVLEELRKISGIQIPKESEVPISGAGHKVINTVSLTNASSKP